MFANIKASRHAHNQRRQAMRSQMEARTRAAIAQNNARNYSTMSGLHATLAASPALTRVDWARNGKPEVTLHRADASTEPFFYCSDANGMSATSKLFETVQQLKVRLILSIGMSPNFCSYGQGVAHVIGSIISRNSSDVFDENV